MSEHRPAWASPSGALIMHEWDDTPNVCGLESAWRQPARRVVPLLHDQRVD
jgi:hypothetical protein